MREKFAQGFTRRLGVEYEMSKAVVMDTFCNGICHGAWNMVEDKSA